MTPFAFLLLLALAACRSEKTFVSVEGVPVERRLLHAADRQGFDYTGHLSKALRGSEPSAVALLRFSKDCDTSLWRPHGTVLDSLYARLGETDFTGCIHQLTPAEKPPVWAAMTRSGAPPETLRPSLLPVKGSRPYEGLYSRRDGIATFRDCGLPDERFQVIDPGQTLEIAYRHTLGLPYPGQSAFVRLQGYTTPYWADKSLAKGHSAFLVVTELSALQTKNFRNTCIPYDFWAIGNEPYWTAQVSAAEELIEFRTLDGADMRHFPYLPPVVTDTARIFASLNTDTGDNILVTIRPQPCTDGMSDRNFRHSVEIAVNGRRYQGCAVAWEDFRGKD